MSYRKKRYQEKHQKNEPENVTYDREYVNPGVERMIYTGKLTSSQAYQRPVNPKEVERLIQEWDDRLLDPIVVSFRDGRFNVIDGQHRIVALRMMNGGKDVMVNCKVFSGLTYEQEADLCYKLDRAKKRLSLSQATNALAESGANAEIAEVKRIVENCGFVWALNKRTGKTGEIVAARSVIDAYRLLGGALFTRMCSLLWNTWKGNPRSLSAAIISGMALFVKTYDAEIDDRTFIKRLSSTDPYEIVRRGKADFSTSKASLRYARIILEKFNAPRGRKLPYRLH